MRRGKIPYYSKLSLNNDNLYLIAHSENLMNWNVMEQKPTEAQILHQANLESRQQRRDNLKRDIDELATTPEKRILCETFVLQMTNDGQVDVNDLPVEERLQLTREGIQRLLNN